jgi:hypothetical protein
MQSMKSSKGKTTGTGGPFEKQGDTLKEAGMRQLESSLSL